MAKLTLEGVAQKARVSVSTVSRVLNGKTGVNEGTRRRVLSILAASDYGPRQTPDGKSHRVLGLLVPAAAQRWGLQTNFIQEGLRAITDVARQSNYVTMVGAFDPELGGRAEDRMIIDRQFAGVLLFRTRDEEADSRPLRDHGIPYIVVNRLLPGTPFHYLGVDHCEVGFRAAQYLIETGYRRIAILVGDPQYVSHKLYLEGYRGAHAAAGLNADPGLVQTIELNAEEGYLGTQELMKRRPRPDALILPSDRSGIGSLRALRELKVKVPEDLGILAIDGTRETAFADPPLTAIEIPWYDMLALGTLLLIRMIEDRPAIENIGIRFGSKLVVRESTRAKIGRARVGANHGISVVPPK